MIYDETILTELFTLKADNFDNQVEGVAKISVLLFIILCLFYSVKTSIKIYLVLIFIFVSVYYTVLINQNNKILLNSVYILNKNSCTNSFCIFPYHLCKIFIQGFLILFS